MRTSDRRWLRAGLVGGAHGLDGSFYVAEPRPQLLERGAALFLAGHSRRITRRAGTDRRPIVRLEGCDDRAAAAAVRGQELLSFREQAPELGPDEWWVEDLEGCAIHDGGRPVGWVRRVLALPSCEVLEVARLDGRELLIPLVGDAVRSVDVERATIDVSLGFLGESA